MKKQCAAIGMMLVMSGCGGMDPSSNDTADDPSLAGAPSGDNSLHEQSVESAPYISSLSPVEVAIGDTLTINGSNLGGVGTALLETVACAILTKTSTKITCTVGAGTPSGRCHVVAAGVPSNYKSYTIRGDYCVPGHQCQ